MTQSLGRELVHKHRMALATRFSYSSCGSDRIRAQRPTAAPETTSLAPTLVAKALCWTAVEVWSAPTAETRSPNRTRTRVKTADKPWTVALRTLDSLARAVGRGTQEGRVALTTAVPAPEWVACYALALVAVLAFAIAKGVQDPRVGLGSAGLCRRRWRRSVGPGACGHSNPRAQGRAV